MKAGMTKENIYSGDRSFKVYLTGGEGANWALDQDYENTRSALTLLNGLVELVDIEEAEIVHTVWDKAIDRIDRSLLIDKFVVCHVCTNVYKMLEQADPATNWDDIGLWVTQTAEASEAASQLKLPYFNVPYSLDLEVFGNASIVDSPEKRAVDRQALGIQQHEFLIGNFMRDSLGVDLDSPKPEKGADIFLEIVKGLKKQDLSIHILLAGPRRHWLRKRLTESKIPVTFVGQVVEHDDVSLNILPLEKIASLYHLVDLVLITSRHEGGPRAILEAAASKTPILSTPVGLAKDVLDPSVLYSAIDEGIEKISRIVHEGYGAALVQSHWQRVGKYHSIEAVAAQFSKLYKVVAKGELQREVPENPAISSEKQKTTGMSLFQIIRKSVAHFRGRSLPGLGIKICLWHEFHKPPYGGGNQFMLALKKGLRQLGVTVVSNQLDDSIDVHICNAVWFDQRLLEKLSSGSHIRIIHRLDGLVHIARDQADKSIDDQAYVFNRRYATATVMQSEWCLQQATELGYKPVRQVIIRNACDPTIFYSKGQETVGKRRLRIIASSWSDNPMKGTSLYKQMEKKLDWAKFDFTFVGRTRETFDRIKVVSPLSSTKLAKALRQHDIYITASKNEACSNALIEALSCGLPALYLYDSSNPEVVGWGGLPFNGEDDVLSQLDRLANSYKGVRNCIYVDSLEDVAMRYLELAREIRKK